MYLYIYIYVNVYVSVYVNVYVNVYVYVYVYVYIYMVLNYVTLYIILLYDAALKTMDATTPRPPAPHNSCVLPDGNPCGSTNMVFEQCGSLGIVISKHKTSSSGKAFFRFSPFRFRYPKLYRSLRIGSASSDRSCRVEISTYVGSYSRAQLR